MTNPKLSIRSRKAQQPDGFADHTSPLDNLENSSAVYLDWNDGRISQIYSFDSESPSLVNFKKGIASLFQLQSSNAEIIEMDASGSCSATYKNLGERTLLKKKSNCRFERPNSSFSRPQKVCCMYTFVVPTINLIILCFFIRSWAFPLLAIIKPNII